MNAVFLDTNWITIGNNVKIGPRVNLLTAGHPIDAQTRISLLEFAAPITIGDNTWLGGNVTVLPGVTIGSNSVIGAGAVVTKDIPDGVVAVGNPARVLRKINAADRKYWRDEAAATGGSGERRNERDSASQLPRRVPWRVFRRHCPLRSQYVDQ
ncbi:sugar O-acetyltransferase [Lacticaseibacillus sharpeae]|uniref:sugar O-acetyltransferase n=1 Tax=Lacticaseibacillus sharpeae TaxID=1626 RepID=UPI000A6D54A2|nr:sugar O-acetyltransferase [Lacticaseibacillus sharpeae]